MPDTALSIKQLYIPGKMITSGTIVGSWDPFELQNVLDFSRSCYSNLFSLCGSFDL